MNFNFNLLAEEPSGFGNMGLIVVFYIVILGGAYFLFLRPSSKKKKKEAELRSNVEIGDDITTIGGIVGRVISIKDDSDEIIVETGADRTKLRIKRWAISTVDTVKEGDDSKKTVDASKPDKKDKKTAKEAKSKECK